MSEMIRRMVTAYRASLDDQSVWIDWETRQHQAMAAAVEAMRQPTEAMEAAGFGALHDIHGPHGSADGVWYAMIESALEPTPPTGSAGE